MVSRVYWTLVPRTPRDRKCYVKASHPDPDIVFFI